MPFAWLVSKPAGAPRSVIVYPPAPWTARKAEDPDQPATSPLLLMALPWDEVMPLKGGSIVSAPALVST